MLMASEKIVDGKLSNYNLMTDFLSKRLNDHKSHHCPYASSGAFTVLPWIFRVSYTYA